jgi:hypothetical protein
MVEIMGGDDLDDSDDLVWIKPVRGESGIDDDSSTDADASPGTQKRALRPDDSSPPEEVGNSNKKARKEPPPLSTQQVLWKAGRNLHQQTNVEQAQFLTTAMRHHALLQNASTAGAEASPEDDASQISILPYHCLKKDYVPESETTDVASSSPWLNHIRAVVSLKTLRDWKPIGSPCIVIICASARRAVSLLKHELAPFKVRTAKLFPKNGSVQEQSLSLMAASIPIAVGTPHRLRQLSSYGIDEKKGRPCFQWDHTQLVILDAFPQKQYTVCTLPDTAAECMHLLREFVYPQLVARVSKRKKGASPHQRSCQITFLA